MIRGLIAAGLVATSPLAAQTTTAPPPAVAELQAADSSISNDATYLHHAVDSDSYEVASSQLALQRSRNRQIRAFAQMMINHHTRSAAELARIHGSARPTLGQPQSEPKSQMLEKLRTSGGKAFEENYVQGQIAAHEEALSLHRTYASTGGNAQLRAFAARTAPLVESHLARARTLRPMRR